MREICLYGSEGGGSACFSLPLSRPERGSHTPPSDKLVAQVPPVGVQALDQLDLFHERRHFLSCFSRTIAASAEPWAW